MPTEKVSLLDGASEEMTTTDVMITPTEGERKRKRNSEECGDESGLLKKTQQVEEAGVPAVFNDEMEKTAVLSDTGHLPGSSHDSSKLPAEKPITSEDMALNSMQNALEMCARIKTEELPVAGTSGVDTADTMGYVHYYLRTAYQLLFGAALQNPAGSTPLEGIIHQSQERATFEPSPSNRARRRRVKRVWNGEAFVPEGQAREQTAPYPRRRRPRRN
ncbi:uncharacterized protein LOC144646637 [Oculina patagonica]